MKFLKLTENGIQETDEMGKVLALGENGLTEVEVGGSGGWQPHPDWIDISEVGDNEINLLVSDGGVGVAFAVTVAGGGTYTIDWGDGTVETNRASGTTYGHQYTIGSGQPVNNGQYTVFKIRIYNASNTITRFQVRRMPEYNQVTYQPILWAVFGTQGITDYSYTFYSSGQAVCKELQACVIPSFQYCTSTVNMFSYCSSLSSVILPSSWGNVTSVSSMFSYCFSLSSVILPSSWGNVTNVAYMFSSCSSLSSVVLPLSWENVSNTISMFSNCSSLSSVVLPSSWGNVTNVASMFSNCSSLSSVVLPSSWGNVTNVASMFSNCSSLSSVALPSSWGNVTNVVFMFLNNFSFREIPNIEYLGSQTSDADFTDIFRDCEPLSGTITIASRLSKIGIYSSNSSAPLKVTGVRLTNSNSGFGGSSPQVDVSYCSMDANALNQLFQDLPARSGRTIKITGNPGASTCDTSIATSKGWTVVN